ncbi:hypothetical protein LSH36_2792g00001, partial [Paralvinella palmiformis]
GTSTTNSRNYSIIKKAMFGEEVHCLLKDGNYYILLEELRVLFFSHLSFFKLKQISQRLVSSTALIPVDELKNLSPYLGIIRHGDMIRVEEVKLFLVNTKALLQKRENRKESTNTITDHKGFLGLKLRKLRHRHKEQEHILSSGNNVNNMLILNYSNLPVSYFTGNKLLKVIPRDIHQTSISGESVMMPTSPTKELSNAIQNVALTSSGTARNQNIKPISGKDVAAWELNISKPEINTTISCSDVTKPGDKESDKKVHEFVEPRDVATVRQDTSFSVFHRKQTRLLDTVDKIVSKKCMPLDLSRRSGDSG